MKRLFGIIMITLSIMLTMNGESLVLPWSEEFQTFVMGKVGGRMAELSNYPTSKYPNENIEPILEQFPEKKVLLFGYGSLINRESALRSLSPEAVATMRSAAAFGFKRIFNYRAETVSRWGENLPENERAMLNIEPMTTPSNIINGVLMEISAKDLKQLVKRELGYDLTPLLVADWNDLTKENPFIDVKLAYTFLVPHELREGVEYSHTDIYPVRGYLHAVQEGASEYGEDFLRYWNQTTYMGDGTTLVTAWDQKTFSGLLSKA